MKKSLILFLASVSGQVNPEGPDGFEGKPDGMNDPNALMYIECKLDRMCAFMSESWLESQGIYEEDTPWLTLVDKSCEAQDIGSLEGLGDEHFWVWCSREYTAEEELTHEDEDDSLAHYNCGTSTGIHSGEAGATGWQVEPHIRHNNTIQTPPERADKKV